MFELRFNTVIVFWNKKNYFYFLIYQFWIDKLSNKRKAEIIIFVNLCKFYKARIHFYVRILQNLNGGLMFDSQFNLIIVFEIKLLIFIFD